MMNKSILMMLSKVAESAMKEAAEAEGVVATEEANGVIIDAIEDLYSTAAICTKLSEWVALQPEAIEDVPQAIVTLCIEIGAAVRAESAMGVQGSLINHGGEKTWH